MTIVYVTVSLDRAKNRSQNSNVLFLSDEAAYVYRNGLVVKRIQYAERGFFIEQFRSRLSRHSDDGRYLLLFLFSNSLYLSFFYPLYKRIKAVADYLAVQNTQMAVFLDPVIDTDVFPITGAEGDNTYNLSWDRRVVLKYIVDYLKGQGVKVEYRVASKFRVVLRRCCIFAMKLFIVSIQFVLSNLLSKNSISSKKQIYIVRDERTVRELDIKPDNRIIFNPSFRCYKHPKLLVKYFRASEKIPPRLYRKKSFFQEFQVDAASFTFADHACVDLKDLAIAIYREHYEKICYYGGLRKINLNAEEIISPEFIGPIGFLESRAWFGKVKLITVQTFALDVTRVSFLPKVDLRVYSTLMDKRFFAKIECAIIAKVKKASYIKSSEIDRVKSICLLTQPNFNMASGIKPILDGLIEYAKHEDIVIKLRVHPRDASDYSAYASYIDTFGDPKKFVISCDLVVAKTTSMINDALLVGVPFVTFAGDESQSLPYMAFNESHVGCVDDIINICRSINEYIAQYRKFQEVYFSEELDAGGAKL